MEAQASVHQVRITARKLRLVCDQIRGTKIARAKIILENSPKKCAHLVHKVLDAAIANAVNNSGSNAEHLYVSAIFADEGKTYKRFRAGGRGRAFPILKRTSHLTIKLKTRK